MADGRSVARVMPKLRGILPGRLLEPLRLFQMLALSGGPKYYQRTKNEVISGNQRAVFLKEPTG